MIVYTDSPKFAGKIFPGLKGGEVAAPNGSDLEESALSLLERFFPNLPVYKCISDIHRNWRYAFIAEYAPSSHFDHIVELIREETILPDRIVCLAGQGEKFHGQRGRPWSAVLGNIHLTIFFKPERIIKHFHAGFPAMAAVSVIETLDGIRGLKNRAAIKWVNDILIDRAKVAGFIAHSQIKEKVIKTAVMGIGINVETKPEISPNPFMPEVTSLCRHVSDPSDCTQSLVLAELLRRLHDNYINLCEGQAFRVIEAYKRRSLVIGQRVVIYSDSPGKEDTEIAAGLVMEIGNNLELYLEGQEKPVSQGRLLLKI